MDLRDLEDQERRAVLNGDTDALKRFWHDDFVVNAPNNAVLIGREAVIQLIEAGVVAYDRFDRHVEHLALTGDVAASMGSEMVQPKNGPQAGQTLERRYTNIWQRTDGSWQMVFRHANLVGGEQDLGPPRP